MTYTRAKLVNNHLKCMPAKSLSKIIQRQAYHLVFLQLAGVFGLALLALIFCGRFCAFSVLMGGLAYGLTNLFFVWRVFRYAGAKQMTLFIAAFFFGEMLKLILSGFLFLLIVKYLPVSLLSVLVGFIGGIVSFWIACVWSFSRKTT